MNEGTIRIAIQIISSSVTNLLFFSVVLHIVQTKISIEIFIYCFIHTNLCYHCYCKQVTNNV